MEAIVASFEAPVSPLVDDLDPNSNGSALDPSAAGLIDGVYPATPMDNAVELRASSANDRTSTCPTLDHRTRTGLLRRADRGAAKLTRVRDEARSCLSFSALGGLAYRRTLSL